MCKLVLLSAELRKITLELEHVGLWMPFQTK